MGTIASLNTTPYKEQPVPEVDKEYHIFDDGKIKPSRHYTAKMLEVLPFSECKDQELLDAWMREITTCSWLYNKTTDYFVKAVFSHSKIPQYFVRTTDGGWFSLGFFAARLDIDGSLYTNMINTYGEDCLEC